MPTAFGVTVGVTRRVGIDAGGSCRGMWSRYLLVSMIEMPNALDVDPSAPPCNRRGERRIRYPYL
ncbi:MAG TPA: hypothetical protein VHX39_04255 [Acetobacteraceae bacterium]|nr:hypothetical protein [Acetobacteraceae bacterium]